MAEREAALQAEKQLELDTRAQEHSKQLATLGRKLAETESQLSGTREREKRNEERAAELEGQLDLTQAKLAATGAELEQTQQARAGLESELAETIQARDALQRELESSRATVQGLTASKRDLESRVGALEALKSQLESKLSMAVEKIATDDALLERVRKAMAIGISLLEEQKKNSYGEVNPESEGASEDAE
jgi:chromosome segregation ATPase